MLSTHDRRALALDIYLYYSHTETIHICLTRDGVVFLAILNGRYNQLWCHPTSGSSIRWPRPFYWKGHFADANITDTRQASVVNKDVRLGRGFSNRLQQYPASDSLITHPFNVTMNNCRGQAMHIYERRCHVSNLYIQKSASHCISFVKKHLRIECGWPLDCARCSR